MKTSTAKDRPDQGGNLRSIDLRVYDELLFGKHLGHPVELEWEETLVMGEQDNTSAVA